MLADSIEKQKRPPQQRQNREDGGRENRLYNDSFLMQAVADF